MLNKLLYWLFVFQIGSSNLAADIIRVVADGSVVEVEGKGFSIQPLPGWTVIQGDPTVSLILEAPEIRNNYQANIQINTFNEKMYIDSFSTESLRRWFRERLDDKAAYLQNLTERDVQNIDLPNGAKGLMFFYEFVAHGKPMVQTNLVVSSNTRHYILTYNDLKTNFEPAAGSSSYDQAWTIMSSMKADSQVGSRYDLLVDVGLLAAIILTLVALFFGLRYWRGSAMLREFDADDMPPSSSMHGGSISKSLNGDDVEEEDSHDEYMDGENADEKTTRRNGKSDH
jgi:hypothetical protein